MVARAIFRLHALLGFGVQDVPSLAFAPRMAYSIRRRLVRVHVLTRHGLHSFASGKLQVVERAAFAFNVAGFWVIVSVGRQGGTTIPKGIHASAETELTLILDKICRCFIRIFLDLAINISRPV